MEENDKNAMLRELKKISKVLTLANAKIIEEELSKVANTTARKKMWVLMDGRRMPKDLAEETGVTNMAVSIFLKAATSAELAEYTQREAPRRVLDYVPPSWLELLEKEEREASREQKCE